MNERPKTLEQRVREAIASATDVAPMAQKADWRSAVDMEALARAVSAASSHLNGAAQRLRRIAKQLNKSGAAGAVQHTRK